jgi:hypothetical protein
LKARSAIQSAVSKKRRFGFSLCFASLAVLAKPSADEMKPQNHHDPLLALGQKTGDLCWFKLSKQ